MKVKKQYKGGITVATVKYNLGPVGGMAVTELWSGTSGQLVGKDNDITVTLNDDITNYKLLVFDFKVSHNSGKSFIYNSKIITPSQIINLINDNNINTWVTFCWGYGDTTDYYELHAGGTTRTLKAISNNTVCLRIVGIN